MRNHLQSMHRTRDTSPSVWTATGRERPIFLDEEGRRRRWVLLAGAVAAAASALWLAALIAGAIGFSTLPRVGAVRAHPSVGLAVDRDLAPPRTRLIAQR